MFEGAIVKVIIPALNESASIGKVLGDIPTWVSEVIVVDNGSTDETALVATAAGASVVSEPRRGYGQACLAGMAAIDWCDVVVFLDGDYSDFPQQMDRLVRPIVQGRYDMVLGKRVAVGGQAGAFTLPQKFGTALACYLMRLFWGGRYQDMGPFRAIRWSNLCSLKMRDRTFGWTVEMQIKAILAKLRAGEVPVDYRSRIGTSKISGTIRGVCGAGIKILGTIGKYLLYPPDVSRSRTERLIIFGRWPRPGTTKTRLIPALGALGAAELQRKMTVGIMNTARQWANGDQRVVEFQHEGGSWRKLRRWLGGRMNYHRQQPGDLGQRIASAIKAAFNEGSQRVVLIGTDSPGITQVLLDDAFDALDDHDLVLGSTLDGGYWLIGMARPLPVFDGVTWSTEHVFAQTLEIAKRHGLKIHLLPSLRDVDLPEDLAETSEFFNPDKPVLSVVIPTINEADNIAATLQSANAKGVEIIVVDGGSTDGTLGLAKAAGARVISTTCGRAPQQNAGAALAQGDIILFLHADTLLPANYASDVFEAMLNNSAVGGNFLWRTTLDTFALRMLGYCVKLRTLYSHEPWGDQAIFVRKADFEAIGGFSDVPIAEDWDFVRALRRRGRIVVIPKTVITSGRRWQRIGVLKTFLINKLVVLGCYLGFPRSLLKKLY